MIYFELTGYYVIVCLRYQKRSYINSCVRCDIQCDIWKNAKSLFSDNKRNRISCHISLSDKLIHRQGKVTIYYNGESQTHNAQILICEIFPYYLSHHKPTNLFKHVSSWFYLYLALIRPKARQVFIKTQWDRSHKAPMLQWPYSF